MRPSIIETVVGRRCILHVAGELDIASRPELQEACARARGRDGRCRLVVDLTRVEFIDGAGLREVAATVRDRQLLGDPAVLVVSSAFLCRLLDVTGYARGVTVVPDLPTALHGIDGGHRPAAG